MSLNNIDIHPENYILLGNPQIRKADADALILEAKSCHPEKFEGNEDSFSFELRYSAPFDKGFFELKRLQGTAAEIAGRRSNFKGYIVLDLSRWLAHHNEDYLNRSLLFLVDMSDYWKYIFLVDDKNSKAAQELVGKVLAVFFCEHIPCMVKEATTKCSQKARINALCKEQEIICSPSVLELLQKLMAQKFSENIVSALLCEVSCNSGKRISMNMLADFMADRNPAIRYMLTQKEFDRFMNIVGQWKENCYGKKEAVQRCLCGLCI